MLDIYAGNTACKVIKEQGIKPELFSAFLGASGGPKWFSLFELDKYIFGEFFKHKKTPLNLIGSSAGAFRSACFAQANPVAAITRMAEAYAESAFSAKAKPDEVTQKAKALLDHILGETGCEQIIHNPVFKAHFLINKTNGLVSFDNKILQMLGLVKSMGLNRFDRKWIRDQYERFVFRPKSSQILIDDYCQFRTHYVDLSKNNLKNALLASGSIPLVMKGVKNIAGVPAGTYRDGGIIDYHFDVKLKNSSGLTLYPHFNASPKAGWFDKNLKREVKAESYDNVLMLVPSKAFVNLLPYGKIPDRSDFEKLAYKERVAYWKTVLSETERLSDAFARFCQHPEKVAIQVI